MQIKPVKALVAATFFTLSFGVSLDAVRADDATVLATVGGEPITEGEVKLAETSIDPEIARLPAEQRRVAALAALVDIRTVAQKARLAKVEETDEFKRLMAFLSNRQLHDLYFKQQIVDKITDADVRTRYDKEIAATPPQNEVRARHILVKTEDEAKAVIKELEGGANFEDVAKAKSTDGAAAQGGDLGYFGAGQMVPEFEKQAFTLEVGQYSKEPVKTDFGFHVIKVEDKRAKQPPAFDEVKAQVRDVLLREKYVELMKGLRTELKVDYVDPATKKAMEDAQKPPVAPAADGAAPAPDAAAPAEAPKP